MCKNQGQKNVSFIKNLHVSATEASMKLAVSGNEPFIFGFSGSKLLPHPKRKRMGVADEEAGHMKEAGSHPCG